MNWTDYSRILLEKCMSIEKPYYACFELTPFCNFKCDMCYVRLEPEQAKSQGNLLTTQQWIRIAEETRAMGTVSLEVTGGEAVTRPDFQELYQRFISMGFVITLRSNGYLMNDKMINFLKQYPPYKITVSLYGASNQTYKKICDIENGFTVVTQNILAMRDAGLNIKLIMTTTRENMEDKKQVYIWAKNNGFSMSYTNGLITPIRGAKRSVDHLRICLNNEEDWVNDEIVPTERDIPDREKYKNPFWMCRAFGAMCCISWDGRMTLCNSFPAIWSDPLANGVQEAYKNLYRCLKELKRPKKCETCQVIDFCSTCPSQFLSTTGNPECTSDEICERAWRLYKRYYVFKGLSDDQKQSLKKKVRFDIEHENQ